MRLYHTGFSVIEKPDIYYGRKNADLGQGFYTSADRAFSVRWARTRKDSKTWLNTYELDTEGLRILHFDRNEEWFEYIYRNRHLQEELYPGYDLVVGPIANDTIFDTIGIITSGLLKKEDAMKLLLLGPVYNQTVLRSERAVSQLTFIQAEELTEEEIGQYRQIVAAEEAEYQKEFAQVMESL